MSFSSRAKEELVNDKLKKPCCRLAALSALVQMSGSLQLGGGKKRLRLTTESYAVARWGVQLAKSLYPLETEILVRERKRLGKNRSFAILMSGDAVEQVLFDTGLMSRTEEGYSLEGGVPASLVQEECCRRAFLRGAFMGGGSISNPERGYHLEFVVRTERLAYELCDTLNAYELNAKVVLRKGSNVVYLKESEKITEFLTLIGAHGALLDLENVRIYKDFRNHLNRQVNCETANISKTVNAATRQIENIQYLIQHEVFRTLSPALRETAEARINNPEATLSELGQMLSEPIGKSGVNHRLRRLENIALELKSEKGDA